MSGNLNSFRANLDTSFDNLGDEQFNALYEEVLKEKAKRLIGKMTANNNPLQFVERFSTRQISLATIIFVHGNNYVITANEWTVGPLIR